MYTVRILTAASRDLSRLDKSVGRRIVERINWLAENFDRIQPEPLSGDLTGFSKFRVGDYRVIYEVFEADRLIMIHTIGHRREIYRNR